jgi:hypothetical protein
MKEALFEKVSHKAIQGTYDLLWDLQVLYHAHNSSLNPECHKAIQGTYDLLWDLQVLYHAHNISLNPERHKAIQGTYDLLWDLQVLYHAHNISLNPEPDGLYFTILLYFSAHKYWECPFFLECIKHINKIVFTLKF